MSFDNIGLRVCGVVLMGMAWAWLFLALKGEKPTEALWAALETAVLVALSFLCYKMSTL